MERLTKRILAIVLIAVVGVGVGVTVWIFVAPYSWGAKDAPGAPPNITEDQIIRMGVLGGIYDIQGRGALEGSRLAAYEINQAGGITVNGKTYYIGITAEDTDESNPNLDTTKGVAAAERIINYKRVQFITGGFRTEALDVYLETVMSAKVPFIDSGAATDSFCQNVLDNYDRYKYFFRDMPINSTALGGEIIAYILTMQAVLSSKDYANRTIYKFGLLYEALDWTTPLVNALKHYLGLYGLPIVSEVAYPITALQTDFDGYISDIQNNDTQILIPVISAQGGILMMNSYASQQPGFVVIGIDVQSQLDSFWGDSNGNCEYETVMQALGRTAKTPVSIPFWDAYREMFDHDPLYTAVGSYDAIKMYAWAINETQSFDANDIVAQLEEIKAHNPIFLPYPGLPGAGGYGAFTRSHDVFEGYPFGYTLFVQWHGGDQKVVVPSFGAIYPNDVVTGNFTTPAGDPDWDNGNWDFNL
jgi:branched-chain amino acid transport system substrate-binding protein